MDTLISMRAFVRVVELGSFAAAARSLGMSPAMVTKHVAHLEARTGARLLNRTTRQVRPTDVGEAYHARCVALLAGVEEAEAEAGARTTEPSGTLRITAPVEFGNAHLAPLMGVFMTLHPRIEIVLDLTNRAVDLVQEGFDVAIRIARSLDTGLVGKRLATSRFHVVASPGYLRAHGRPTEPKDLARHACLTFGLPAPREVWPFERDGRLEEVRIRPRLISTSAEVLCRAARDGAGITWLPSFVCGAELKAGTLVSLFPGHATGSLVIWALIPHRRLLPARTRAFLDHLVDALSGGPDVDPWGG